MYLDFINNNGKRYMRIVQAVRRPNKDGVMSSHKDVILNVGPVRQFDDGKPDLERRLREQFKAQTLKIDGFDYESTGVKPTPKDIVLHVDPASYPKLKPENIGWFFLDALFEQLGIGDVLRQYKSDRRIEYDLLNLIKLYVFQRILRPDSKRGTLLYLEKHPMFDMPCSFHDKNTWYRALTVLSTLFDKIQTRMDTKITQSDIGRKRTLLYYDVTNIYFEIPYEDDPVYLMDENGKVVCNELNEPVVLESGFREKGKSKEERHLPLVQISLAIDENGLPVSINLFEGNTSDSITFKNYLDEGFSKSDEHCIFVADNGMYSQFNFYRIVSQKNGYIIRKSTKKSWSTMREWILDSSGWNMSYQETKLAEDMQEKDETNASPEADATPAPKKRGRKRKAENAAEKNSQAANCSNEVNGDAPSPDEKTESEVSFKFKSRVVNRTDKKDKDSGESITYKTRQIVYWSKALYKKDKHDGEKLREDLEQVKQKPEILRNKNHRLRRFLKEEYVDKETGEILQEPKTLITILEDALAQNEEQYGYLILETTEISFNELVILGKYHGLSRIEASFRICKSDLDIRPVYVSLKEHIRGHVLICFMALTIMRLIQVKVMKHKNMPTSNTASWTFGISAEDVQEALQEYQVSLLQYPYYIMNSLSENQKLLHQVFGIPEIDIPTKNSIQDMKYALKKSTL